MQASLAIVAGFLGSLPISAPTAWPHLPRHAQKWDSAYPAWPLTTMFSSDTPSTPAIAARASAPSRTCPPGSRQAD